MLNYLFYHNVPGYRRRLYKKALQVAGEYSAWKKILQKPYVTRGEIAGDDKKTLSSEMKASGATTRAQAAVRRHNIRNKWKRFKKGLVLANKKKVVAFGKRKLAKAAAKSKFVPMHSTGYVGAFKKPRTVSRPKRASLFDSKGVVFKREYANVATAGECVYVGHGTPLTIVVNNAIRALLRTMLIKGGTDVSDWNDAAGFNAKWQIYYTLGTATTTLKFEVVVSDFTTYVDIATSMTDLIRAQITDADTLETITFVTSRLLVTTDGITPTYFTQFSEVNLKNYTMYVDYWSICKIKNVTLAGDATDGDLITNVESQPLRGINYATQKWGNGFQLYKQLANGGKPTISASPTNGAIAVNGKDLGYLNLSSNPFLKVPPAYMLETSKYSKVRINPGELKTDVARFKCRMSFNALMNKLIFSVNQFGDGNFRQFGCAHMFAFERDVEIGTVTDTSIRVAFQVDFVLKMRGTAGAHKVAPITNISE